METSHLQLTPEMRAALSASGGAVQIADDETRKVYLLIEQGQFPDLEEEYIRDGLEFARQQIARGQISEASIDEVIEKARQSKPANS